MYSRLSALPLPGFTYLRAFLTFEEQRVLAKAALDHLDAVGTSAARRKHKRMVASGVLPDETGFLPDASYEFEEGHFDGVIRHYREARVTDAQWATLGDQSLGKILERLRLLLPPVPLQTHVLHLAAKGEILPHIDNVDASGSIILALSLGTPRILRLEDEKGRVYDHLLEPGSCYIQRDAVRYHFKHSILNTGSINGISIQPGQRLSIMMRDMLKS